MPTLRIPTDKGTDRELFEKIRIADLRDWVMSAACNSDSDGLHAGHAYTLSAAMEFIDEKGKHWELVRMRNPWARETYTGPWNDHDERWTLPIRRHLKFIDRDDGTFWMPLELFRKRFNAFYLGMYQNWQVNRWYVGPK